MIRFWGRKYEWGTWKDDAVGAWLQIKLQLGRSGCGETWGNIVLGKNMKSQEVLGKIRTDSNALIKFQRTPMVFLNPALRLLCLKREINAVWSPLGGPLQRNCRQSQWLCTTTWNDFLFLIKVSLVLWLPRGLSGKEPTCPHMRYKTLGFDPWLGKIPRRRKWQPVPGFLPGKSHGQKEPGGLQSMGSQEVQCDWASEHILWRLVQSCIRKLSLFFFPFNKQLKVLLYEFIMIHMTS